MNAELQVDTRKEPKPIGAGRSAVAFKAVKKMNYGKYIRQNTV